MLTWKELRQAKKKDLEQKARESFDEYLEKRGLDHHALLIEAQTYQIELRRREEQWSWCIEIFIDILIIGLIGLEIYEGYQQGVILQHLEQSSAATASLLTNLKPTLEAMNRTLATQLEQANQVLLDADVSPNGYLLFVNRGRTNLVIYKIKEGSLEESVNDPLIIQGPGTSRWPLAFPINMLSEMQNRTRYTMQFEVYLESDDGTQYVGRTDEIGSRGQNGVILTTIRPLKLSKTNWRN